MFGNIEAEGMRLTELAERAGMTKQGVGEAVTDLEGLGYAERVADPSDGRAKIIRLTARGAAAQRAAFEIIGDDRAASGSSVRRRARRRLRSLLIEITGASAALAEAA